MTAPAEQNTAANVGGTTHAVELARSLEVGCLHHVSSIAVAGAYKGTFSEEMFDEGQKLPSPYHRTKWEAERIVREQPFVPWRVYRPAIVVGDSRTGEMDKVDGPYYFFKAIQRARGLLPEWLPLVGVDLGRTNVVPVDWVAGAIDHLIHQPDLDGRAFHLTDPRGQRVDELVNELATAAHAPRFAVSLDKRITRAVPKWPLSLTMALPPWRQLRGLALRELGIPEEVLEHMELVPRFDSRSTQLGARRLGLRAAAGAAGLRAAAVGLLGARDGPQPQQRPHAAGGRRWPARADHRRLLRDRPGRRAAGRRRRRDPAAGRAQRREARGAARGDRRRRAAPRSCTPPTCRRWTRSTTSSRACSPTTATWTWSSTTPAARSAARSRSLRPLSRLRTHDAAQLLRRDPPDHQTAPRHARARQRATS